MDIKIRIYTQTNKHTNTYTDTRSILFEEREFDEMVEAHLIKEQYLKDGEELISITYEEIRP